MSDSYENSIGALVQKAENDYINGTTQISEYVTFSMHDTLERVDAYLNSTHLYGDKDALERDKPFANIVIQASNIWHRATDIDRKHIRLRASKSTDWIDSFLANVHLQDWMRRENFGAFLNEWGRVLSRYGSAVIKFVDNSSGLHIQVVPWNRLIVDAVDFDANPTIEIIELTEAQLRRRIETHGYDEEVVDNLCNAVKTRETIGKQNKDNKSNYIKIYEVHGDLPKEFLTGKDTDAKKYVQQMHVISFVGKRDGKKDDMDEFSLFAGEEATDPYMITHLIKEDGRTLSIGAVEHLFEAQWMQNHMAKSIKDQLDLATKVVFQTSDDTFLGRNAHKDIEHGDILQTQINQPITQVAMQAQDVVSLQNYAVSWKQLGNEIVGISEAMLGAAPKSGTAWRQTEALLQESHNLFGLMTENKGLYIEDIMRRRVIPRLKKKMDTSDEVSATLEAHDITKIDRMYIKKGAIEKTNSNILDKLLAGEKITRDQQAELQIQNETSLQESLAVQGNQRFFKPSELSDKTWKEQFKDLEWDIEVDVTGEGKDIQNNLATLSTALQVMMNPAFAQNKKAQMVVGRILEMTGAISPLELQTITEPDLPAQGVEQLAAPQFNQVA